MSYDMHAHRASVRTSLLKLAAAGPGWHDYVREAAREYVNDDPTLHGDLLEAIQAEIAKQLPIRRGGGTTTHRSP